MTTGHRFHQYYMDGKLQDCTQWKENYEDCQKWNESADEEAANRVIERERARIAERLKVQFGATKQHCCQAYLIKCVSLLSDTFTLL